MNSAGSNGNGMLNKDSNGSFSRSKSLFSFGDEEDTRMKGEPLLDEEYLKTAPPVYLYWINPKKDPIDRKVNKGQENHEKNDDVLGGESQR